MGFTSLYTELIRLEEKPLVEIKEALTQDMYQEYFHISDQDELELSKHINVYARIYNLQGLIQVGEFVGTISPGLNVWVKSDKVDKLVDALKQHYIPENDRDFIVLRKEAFDSNRDWTFYEDCPKYGTWIGPTHQFKNPNANRRIDIQNSWLELGTPLPNGNWDTDFQYWVESVSRKASWNKYKTNHYLSLDIRIQEMVGNNPLTSFARQDTETDNNTKFGSVATFVSGFRNVSFNFINANFFFLLETLPGSPGSGQTGTAASHRGMNGDYGRQECD